jgi:hypothetical protein
VVPLALPIPLGAPVGLGIIIVGRLCNPAGRNTILMARGVRLASRSTSTHGRHRLFQRETEIDRRRVGWILCLIMDLLKQSESNNKGEEDREMECWYANDALNFFPDFSVLSTNFVGKNSWMPVCIRVWVCYIHSTRAEGNPEPEREVECRATMLQRRR